MANYLRRASWCWCREHTLDQFFMVLQCRGQNKFLKDRSRDFPTVLPLECIRADFSETARNLCKHKALYAGIVTAEEGQGVNPECSASGTVHGRNFARSTLTLK
eukprot:gnl/TRDRNA2_/TRDRNA2_176730_c8_seq6.p1 gnl/TRDRNA2_/TRDRNA2_176730_c8~~gnl/TRDRNA2_/TRDRNA2_176730_c8_seq6.p1  ORF type:complete len:104 (-),score=0.44 gnl/TRDRNA2_/TRDRNA2_176730_c8_seq6:2-313(-)